MPLLGEQVPDLLLVLGGQRSGKSRFGETTILASAMSPVNSDKVDAAVALLMKVQPQAVIQVSLFNASAAFIRKMGHKRAHVIGHSNGGNVALVVLVEHPEVTQTAVIQAANAYVTQYLIDREPAVFEPERVARESPGWMNDMIALHGETHGRDYWKDLLQLTVKEIISEPNYAPADLAGVRRPAFVVMGAGDTVNAPDRHAQFIAENIPEAELWIPEGIGHNVHKEARDQWLRRVLDFLERRGGE